MKVNKNGLSESSMVYKKREYIIESLKDLIEVEEILILSYNFKK